MSQGFKLPKSFLLGTATASAQIEGGDKNNTWYDWGQKGHISDGSSSVTACDHWNRVEADTKLLKDLHVQTHRMSLEWSRIEPSPGVFSEEAILHYRNEIRLLADGGIRPLITLHHFSEPLWFLEMGGWRKKENAERFISYAAYAVERLGDLVSDWVTFNEPNVYTKFGYVFGTFPPGEKSLRDSLQVSSAIIWTHVNVYALIHKIRKEKGFTGETRVGGAVHIRIFDGITMLGKLMARVINHLFNELYMTGLTTGRLLFPLPAEDWRSPRGRYADFIGINYYTRNIVEFALDPANYFHQFVNDRDLGKNDLGWDIYPEGIYRACRKYYRKFRLPIFITENGISDKRDNKRPIFIADHLAHIAKAIGEGIEVQRYYHWTLMDNFEWLEGETANFGLYHCDFKTQERKARESAEIFGAICETKEMTPEQYEKCRCIRDELLEDCAMEITL